MNNRQLNNRQRQTLEAIFARPTRANIAWSDIESLFIALGARVVSKGGSVVTITLGDYVATFHRPHPRKEAKKWVVNRVREFLVRAGVNP